MRVRALPLVPEFRDCPVVPRGNEDRVVTEARVAATLGCELAFEHAAHVHLVTARRERDDLGHHARAAVAFALEPLEQGVCLVALRRPARRVEAGATVERLRL